MRELLRDAFAAEVFELASGVESQLADISRIAKLARRINKNFINFSILNLVETDTGCAISIAMRPLLPKLFRANIYRGFRNHGFDILLMLI